ncbi:MAG TPA: helix-turn-helix transcriptional regulator [Rectinemataceae bacterium]|nr:helix-turn-helix transcriptional regulator [Rectinemataceae bacterium]
MGMGLRAALALNLKERRRILGFSQAELSEKASISAGHIAGIELRRRLPTPEVLERLAAALDVPAYRLLMTPEDLESEAGEAERRQAYEVALRIRGHLEEELRELARPYRGDTGTVSGKIPEVAPRKGPETDGV